MEFYFGPNRRGITFRKTADNEPLDLSGVSVGGILEHWLSCSARICSFLTIGRDGLGMASPSAGNEIMGFFHLFADPQDADLGASSAILSNLLLVVLSRVPAKALGSISHRSYC